MRLADLPSEEKQELLGETSPEKKPRRVETLRLADLPPQEKQELLGDRASQHSSDFDWDQAAKAERLRDLQASKYMQFVV